MEVNEKILLLGSLFHDIGKFEQRCTGNKTDRHTVLGEKFLADPDIRERLISIVNNEDNYNEIKKIVKEHHNRSADGLVSNCRIADHISAGERVEKEENEQGGIDWGHYHLASIFSKIRLTNDTKTDLTYYEQELLVKDNYKAIIPKYYNEKDAKESFSTYRNKGDVFEQFTKDFKAVLSFYKGEEDFNTLLNILLVLFEKYMWCIPDFTGSSQTDISLYNHLKDVAGISHALYLNKGSEELNLVIGDMPGIQKYIFNVINSKPAKILRGRSIFVQVFTRMLASIMLEEFGLTDASLIMLAGGKFYILAPNNEEFKIRYDKVIERIERILAEKYNYMLGFASGYYTFNYKDLLRDKETKKSIITFGDIIDRASYNLLEGRNKLFGKRLFNENIERNFVFNDIHFTDNSEEESDGIKCKVTDMPIIKGRESKIKVSYLDEQGKYQEESIKVDKQVKTEYNIGEKITKASNIVLELTDDISEVINVSKLSGYSKSPNKRIILNPKLEELLKEENLKKDIMRSAYILEVASYVSLEDEHVMEFESMTKKNEGAEYLTLLKGDIDNLGLIMSTGLVADKEEEDLTSISRTTTLSNHLKYFFSYFINGFLQEWDQSNKSESSEGKSDQYIYTVFAGGDDLMFITPHSASLKLLKELNDNFTKFTSNNKEVHISYSLTNFKHHTPIRLVADMAEENQEKAKKDVVDEMIFSKDKNKASFRIFNTNLKNDDLENLILHIEEMVKWIENSKDSRFTQGVLRNLLYFGYVIKQFEETNDAKFLLWHPKLVYMINRLLKKDEINYHDKEVGEFIEKVKLLNKNKDYEAKLLEKMLLALTSSVIYKTRNLQNKKQKGENK